MNRRVLVWSYIIAGCIGFIVGLRVFGQALGVFYILTGLVCVYFAFRNDVKNTLSVLVYIVYTEIFIRRGGGVTFVPYLFVQYLMIGVFMILIIRKGGKVKLHSRSLLYIFLYAIIETLDLIRAADITYARSMLTNTIVLLAVTFWASCSIITPQTLNAIIKHIKMATIYLCGNMLVAHFTHHISYTGTSSSEASNFMSAVQLSGYLGVGCSLFFLSVMDDKQRDQFALNLILLCFSVTLMVLTFSRGGLYFVSAIAIVYVIFNGKSVSKYAILLLILPIGYIIYYYVTYTTNGMIEERFSQEGASGRGDLVKAGFTLFYQEPLAGVGTGNFNTEIANRDLFNEESGAHNEFVRAAAEHGVFGILFFWGYFITLLIEIFRRRKEERDFAFYLLLLFSLIIVHNGLKISVQPFILALAIATPSLVRVPKKKEIAAPTNLIRTTG